MECRACHERCALRLCQSDDAQNLSTNSRRAGRNHLRRERRAEKRLGRCTGSRAPYER